MLVSRKYDDAAAALLCGVGTILIATGAKPVPSVIGYLGTFRYGWGALLVAASFAAAIGALLRTRGTSTRAVHRRIWSIRLERIAWPVIGWCSALFCVGVVLKFGVIEAALTLGWAGFVVATCSGHWRVIRSTAKDLER